MLKELLAQVSTKVAAGAMGGILAIGALGAAGVGPVNLISHEDSDHECVELDELAETFDENVVVCEAEPEGGTAEDEADGDSEALTTDDEGGDDSEAVTTEEEGDLPPVPTTTSEAAQIHAFDEACGNHGMYVSFFAQMGFEPPCALLARAGEEQDETMTRQERKKAALQLRKECKARAKAGDPCTPEEFLTPTGDEPAEEEGASTSTAAEAEPETEDAKGKGKDKHNDKEKGGKGTKGGKGGDKATKGKR